MRVLIAGGGTGGHLYPGIAVAEEVVARGGQVLFVGTKRGIEARVVPAAGYPLELLQISGLKRVGPSAFLRGMGRLPLAFLRSLAILRKFRPDVVLGVGGYASGPLVLAAALTGRATAIQEQNSVPGVTNRVLGRVVRAVFTAFDAAASAFPPHKVVATGNPVRRAFTSLALAAPAPGDRAGAMHLLVVGGSQGARAVSDLVLGSVPILVKTLGPLRPLHIVHQTGSSDAERVQKAYAELGLGGQLVAEVRPFIDDMVAAYRDADVVIARAGALTLAELAIAGRPALLIPLPTATDDHQSKNAAAFAQSGAAVVLPQADTTAETLAAELAALLDKPSRRAQMAAAMTTLARPGAAAAVVDHLGKLAGNAGA
jgi:UDP-N-acetylglucosamine--N-acetylmuramyl-(pentapeptide) pyrophosphoryl-undecaprenol N-acetylglucosamine transferase